MEDFSRSGPFSAPETDLATDQAKSGIKTDTDIARRHAQTRARIDYLFRRCEDRGVSRLLRQYVIILHTGPEA